MPRYSIATATDSANDRLILRAKNIFCRILGLGEIRLNFIREDPAGHYQYETPIAGFVHLNGQEIFIRRDIDIVRQLGAVVHECRHCWQMTQDKLRYASRSIKERDARLFEYEFTPPRDPKKIDEWLEEREIDIIRRDYCSGVKSQQKSFFRGREFQYPNTAGGET